MPFTLAHPAVVLPIRHRHFDKSALILGSLAPDFVYFLIGKASLGIGHTLIGIIFINLPLCVLLFYVYGFLSKTIWHYTPNCLNLHHSPNYPNNYRQWIIFVLSALFGMATHILLDSFTHEMGFMVQYFNGLQSLVLGLPIFKWLQYLGGVLGCVFIVVYWLLLAKNTPIQSTANTKQKALFWAMMIGIAFILLILWQFFQTIAFNHYATWIIRIIDCVILSLIMVATYFKVNRSNYEL